MREILFRGKIVDDHEWVYGYVVSVADLSRATIYVPQDPKEFDWATFPFLVDPDTVGQFTGLHDKYGNKIFEGDIVECEIRNIAIAYLVEYGVGEFGRGEYSYLGWVFKDTEADDDFDATNCNISYDKSMYSVIGNKWDNPELLNP